MRPAWKGKVYFMSYEVFHEENNVIDVADYIKIKEQIQKGDENRVGSAHHIRKIYFNSEINYLVDAVSMGRDNSDTFCISMIDFDHTRLLLEKKSLREGTVYKTATYITRAEYEQIYHKDLMWITQRDDILLKDFMRQITLNQMDIGVVADYEREMYRINKRNDYMVFDKSIKSTKVVEGEDLLSPELSLTSRLEKGKLVMTYKQAAYIPNQMQQLLKGSVLTPMLSM